MESPPAATPHGAEVAPDPSADVSGADVSGAGPGLFLPPTATRTGLTPVPETVQRRLDQLRADPTVTAVQAVRLPPDFDEAAFAAQVPPPAFNAFPDVPLAVTDWTVSGIGPGDALLGRLRDHGDTLILMPKGGGLTGRVSVDGEMITIEPVGDGWHLSIRRSPRSLPPDH